MKDNFTKSRKLTPHERKIILAGIYSSRLEFESLSDSAKKAENLNDLIIPWGNWYELTLSQHLAILLIFMGFKDWLVEVRESADPLGEFINMLSELGEVDDRDFDQWADTLDREEKRIFTSLVLAMQGQFEAVSLFSLPMSELVKRAGEGDHEALLRAVTIDRSVISSTPVARQICLAQVLCDESFMNRLSSAITRTKPARPAKKLDDMRYMLEALVEGVGIEGFTNSELEDILKSDLELYDNDSDYSSRAFNKLIQKRNKRVGT
ncbi:hypothetical protein [Zhongshania sp.]|jgi:hypothetical protein|uniref:hypothetical protein n=1 Tax=Zhongshania sp. TaxID=1971902 RepID=UPI0039E52F77